MIITEEEIDTLIDAYPFLSAVNYSDKWYIGIIQNVETQFVWVYDLNKIMTGTEKKEFLKYGDDWYLHSNMDIPVEMFIGARFDKFQHSLRGFSKKMVEEIRGHQVNLSETFERRIKKKKIEIKVAD